MTVVKFPPDEPPVTDVDPDDARRAKAYFDMEPHICDVVYMVKIAVEVLNLTAISINSRYIVFGNAR